MTTYEHYNINSVLHITKKFNCGSTIITLIPSIFFFYYMWCLADTYIAILFNSTHYRRHRVTHYNQRSTYWLQKLLATILVWSGGQCWSDGLIRFLNAYTIVFLTMINNTVKSEYKMNQTEMLSIECIFKSIICYSTVAFIRLYYLHIDDGNYVHVRRRSRVRQVQVHNWYTVLPERVIDELGGTGHPLMDSPPIEPQGPIFTENGNLMKLKNTHSCTLILKKTSILSKPIERRHKSI